MSYVMHVWESPVPHDNDEVWAIIEQLTEQEAGATPRALTQLIERLVARYPDGRGLPRAKAAEVNQFWGEQLRATGPILVVGLSLAWGDELQPFVVEQAGLLGLVCFDMQAGGLYLPKNADGNRPR